MADIDVSQLPRAIQDMATAVRRFENSNSSSLSEANKISKYRMQIAVWVCKHERLEPNLENLVAILGPNFRASLQFLDEVKKEMGYKK
ncbi:MAG: hypothetical protein J6333_12695 [Planctomycetes bacterium]|nr:hypothetical protein [Planctomycetota bacterium]